jgi:hypothetical protein
MHSPTTPPLTCPRVRDQGFVRMAIKYGAVVVPFASLGLEDSLHSVGTVDVGWWLRALEVASPDLRLPLLLPLNGLQRQYFAFGEKSLCDTKKA